MKSKAAPLSPEEYLEWESRLPTKHEYVDGEIHAMSGASRRHNLIATNLIRHAQVAAEGRAGCQVFGPDMKTRIELRNCFYYRDLSVCCDPSDRHELYLVRPCFLVEILSPATAAIDRREKRLAYATLASLVDYVIIDPNRMRVESYRRAASGWQGYLLNRPDDLIESSCLELRLPLERVYRGVEFPDIAEPEPPEYGAEWDPSEWRPVE